MSDCLFCKIVSGEIPAEKVFENDIAYAFLDIHPVNHGHTLVIPKNHHENMYTLPRHTFESLMGVVHYLSPLIKDAVHADGINLGMNNDGAAGQVIFHAHVHIIPRFSNDGHRHWHGAPYKDDEMARVGDVIRKHIRE